MGLTAYTRNDILNHYFRTDTVYVGIFTASGEVSGSSYARQSITFGAPNNGKITNDAEVKFSIAAEDWGNIEAAGVFDAETGGNRLDESSALSVLEVKENMQYSIPVGNYTIEVE